MQTRSAIDRGAAPTQELATRVPDRSYWKSQIKCQAACPVHTDARGYVRAIADGRRRAGLPDRARAQPAGLDLRPRLRRAVRGRLPPRRPRQADRHPRAQALRLRAIRPRGAAGRRPGLIEFLKEAARRRRGAARARTPTSCFRSCSRSSTGRRARRSTGKSVGIIGSGPAGLAAAHDLALLGFDGDDLRDGAGAGRHARRRRPRVPPAARPDPRRGRGHPRSSGCEAVTDCEVGRDVPLPELRQRHDAVVVAVGAKRSRPLPIPGADADGVLGGVEFLRDVALGKPPTLGRRVVVIGGGNVAYDVGRTVLRQISLDAARTALRETGVGEVHLCSLESLDEMPADDVEIIEGDEEGIVRRNSLGPVEILKDDARPRRARCLPQVPARLRRAAPLRAALRRRGRARPSSATTCCWPIGQAVDLRFVDAARDGLEVTRARLPRLRPGDRAHQRAGRLRRRRPGLRPEAADPRRRLRQAGGARDLRLR